MQKRLITQRLAFFIFLIVIFLVTPTTLACRKNQPVEIVIPKEKELVGMVYIDGAVRVPGYYPVRGEDTLEILIRSAGGTTDSADFNHLKLYIPGPGEEEEPQKIDLNRAEAWLLQALPGIGETLARRIVAYRKQKGAFRNISELTKVEGIGATTLSKIKGLITVSDQ